MSEILKDNQESGSYPHPLENMPSFEEHMKNMSTNENGMHMSEGKVGDYDFATPDETQKLPEEMSIDDLRRIMPDLAEVPDLTKVELDGEYRVYTDDEKEAKVAKDNF